MKIIGGVRFGAKGRAHQRDHRDETATDVGDDPDVIGGVRGVVGFRAGCVHDGGASQGVPLPPAKFAKVAMKTTGDQGSVPRARQSSGNRSGRTCSGAGPVDSRET